MALAPILLGFLESPASGYDLKKEFEESVRHFWTAELSQIYPTLHRLRRQGLVDVSTVPSDKGPDRKVYSRTRNGTEELRRWLSEEPEPGTQRLAYLAKLFFLGQVEDPGATRGFLLELRRQFAQRLQTLEAIDGYHRHGESGYPGKLERETVHPYLTLLFGLRRMAATVAWCDECLALLDELEEDRATGERERQGRQERRGE